MNTKTILVEKDIGGKEGPTQNNWPCRIRLEEEARKKALRREGTQYSCPASEYY